jgi:hypothetical protein
VIEDEREYEEALAREGAVSIKLDLVTGRGHNLPHRILSTTPPIEAVPSTRRYLRR